MVELRCGEKVRYIVERVTHHEDPSIPLGKIVVFINDYEPSRRGAKRKLMWERQYRRLLRDARR